MVDGVKYKCPLCECVCDYQHIIEFHREFWDNKFPVGQMPADVESFNKRFGMLGLHTKEVK